MKISKYKYLTLVFSLALLACLLAATGCGRDERFSGKDAVVELPREAEVVVHGHAEVRVSSSIVPGLSSILPQTRSAIGSTTVTYTNLASTNFAISTAGLSAGTFSSYTLNMGSISVSGLDDNHLKVCNPGGNTKCGQAFVRVYTTGSVSGFVHTDGYGAPVFTGSLNPSTALGLTTSGAVVTQAFTIPGSMNRLKLSDLASPSYALSSDFSNAGSGSYSMNYVVEYVLAP